MATNVHHAHRIHHGVDPVVLAPSRRSPAPDQEPPLAGRMSRAARMATLAAAAVGVAAMIAIAWAVIPGSPPDPGTLPQAIAAGEFAPRADDVCARLEARTAAFGFRSDTATWELADARSRVDALDQAASSLRSIGVPASNPGMVDWVTGQLDLARLQAAAVLSAPTTAVAHYRWIAVDPAIERALAPLASIGAVRCGL